MNLDFANDRDLKKSTTTYYFTLEENCISRKSLLETLVGLSTTEARYIATINAFKKAIWLQEILKEIQMLQEDVVVFFDS